MVSALIPVAQAPATIEPMLVPARTSTGMPSRSKTWRTPRCAKPRAEPAPSASPTLQPARCRASQPISAATWPRRSRRTRGGRPSPASAPSADGQPAQHGRAQLHAQALSWPIDGAWARSVRTTPARPPVWAARARGAAQRPGAGIVRTGDDQAVVRPARPGEIAGIAGGQDDLPVAALQRLERVDVVARPAERAEADAGEGRVPRRGAMMVRDRAPVARDLGQRGQRRRAERREWPAERGRIDREEGPAAGVQRQADRQVERQRRPAGRQGRAGHRHDRRPGGVDLLLVRARRRSLRTREMFWARRGELPSRARKSSRPRTSDSVVLIAVTVAEWGCPVRSDISPTNCPGPNCASSLTWPRLSLLRTLTAPVRMMCNSALNWPCCKRTPPVAKRWGRRRTSRAARSSAVKPAKSSLSVTMLIAAHPSPARQRDGVALSAEPP